MKSHTRPALFRNLFFVALVATVFTAQSVFAATLYVALEGNDAWSGTCDAPNATGTDGPKATILGARDAIRATKAVGALTEPVQVLIQGTHAITEPLVFGPEDSGTEAAPITYAAAPDATPIVYGGRRIEGWREENGRWVADVTPGWDFGALWVNGERRTRARTPNAHNPAGDEPTDSELFFMAGPYMEKDAAGAESRSATRFYYRPGDLQAWESLEDAVFVVYHSWETALMRPKAIDTVNRVIEFTGPTAWGFGYWRADQWYFVENLFEALDQPGEWYLNRREGKVYYVPMPGERIDTVSVMAPVAKQLVLLEGKPDEGRFVEYLQFRGLRFYYSEYTIEPQGHSDSQAASSVPAAFQATGARYCVLDQCEIGHVGTYGAWFRAGCQDCRMDRCEVFDLGAGAVRIGECGSPANENAVTQRIVVDNCFLHDGGRIFRGAVGYWVGRSSYNTLSHCEVCDFRYSGLSIGWSWGYEPSSANHNVIECNHVHHVGHGQLSDMGGIYTLGISPGTVIRNNVFHDVLSNGKVSGGWGIYFDEGSTDILAENNVVYNTLTGTLHQHYGKDNSIQNNVFAFSHRAQLIRSREEEHLSFFFDRNIVYFNNGQLLGSAWGNGNYRMDNNCYWDTSGDDIEFAGRTLAEWQAEGRDQHSIIADPKFVDAEHGDFRLAPDSPALALGFQPIDTSQAGLYGDPAWILKPKQIPREPFAPPAIPEPTTIDDGFETTPVGGAAAGASTLGEESEAKIRVTDTTAAS
ncbi:MAG: hypothetical protein QG656_1103 [Candidatus Hydrogenedentes bacterium]|nr:hypothetical protein [Candidatus Hydrogenedentota bacterium]